jgi:hypothetical protein
LESNTYQEVMRSPDADKWVVAMQQKYQAIIDADV